MKKIFYSYASEDFRHLQQLDAFLSPLREKGYIETWHDHQIMPGEKWEAALESKLRTADIVLFLVSPNLLNSPFVIDKTLPIALERMNFGHCHIVPVLLKACLWEETDFAPLEVLPIKGRPIISGYWSGRREEAYYNVAQGLLRFIKNEMNLSKQQFKQSEKEIQEVLKSETERTGIQVGQPDFSAWDEEVFARGLQEITHYAPSIHEILRVSSFDKNASLNGHLTPLIFRKKLMAETAEINELRTQLANLIDSNQYQKSRTIFLTGYPGTGKTTFIRTFMEDHENRYDFELYDLDNVNVNRPTRATDDADKIAERCVLDVLAVAMGSDEEMMVRSFRLIAKNRDFLFKKTFISLTFHKQLEGVADKGFALTFIEAFALLQTLDYRDSFTCFFVNLFNTVTDQRKKVIVFDNLDAINVEHLSNSFLASFSTALWNANNLAQSDLFEYKDLQFTRRFKFIFCLREANFECINAHLSSRLNLTDELPLKFSMETQHFREIVERRLGFYQKLNEDSAVRMRDFQRVRRWFDAFLGDEYFNRVFVPLYNRDYRASVSTLLAVAEASSDQPHWDNFMEDKAPLRGILFFHMTRELRIHNFLKDYVWSPGSNNGQARPYCYLERMLLTTVLNYSQLYSFDDIDQAQTVSLGQLIRDLKIAYTLEEILTSVAKCFLYHRRDWAHLITIQDKEVHSEEKFVREMSALYKRDPAEMDKVRIRLNPAGFIFLRYLLPHFEFYSMMAGNTQALYQIGLGRRVDEAHDRRLAFDFEFALEKAFELARLHIESMNTFFKLKFEKTLPPEAYRASRFAFKHFGSSGPQSRGYFQSTRIITAHIGYIDKFRLFTLTKRHTAPHFNPVDFNRAVCQHLERYVQLLRKTVDDRAISDFYAGFEHNLQAIRASGYEDMTIHVQAREL